VHTFHRLGVSWSLKRFRVSCCFGPVFPLGGYNRTSGRYLAKFDSFQYSVDSSQLSLFWRFAISFRLWLLWSLHSGSRSHLSCMPPACKQLSFLGHLQNHNWWYSARWTPTVMFSCWLCIDRLRNIWTLVDQFRKLLSNVTWSFSLESSWNPIPERGSPTCCCSRTLNYLKACLLQSTVAGAGLNLPLCALFFRY